MQGLGAKQASAKQARLQAIADDNARMENLRVLNEVNAKREEVGRQIREDLGRTDKIIEWAEKSGFNPVTFLNAGGLSHLANWADTASRTSRQHRQRYARRSQTQRRRPSFRRKSYWRASVAATAQTA